MHYNRARSLSLDGRYHSPSGEAAGCEPRATGCFIDGLWFLPFRFNDLAVLLLSGVNYTYRTVSHALINLYVALARIVLHSYVVNL